MSNLSAGRPIEILLIEDNPGDVRLTQEALRTARMPNRLRVAEDGIEAMAMLHREDKYAAGPLPDLILLDLNLPRKDGREVLRELKADPALKRIPIIILTTSQSEPDILRAYDLHANCYITKPVDYERFQAVIKAIENFWLAVVRLPLEKGVHEASTKQ
jgi:CheY-like chemotaxis protein